MDLDIECLLFFDRRLDKKSESDIISLYDIVKRY